MLKIGTLKGTGPPRASTFKVKSAVPTCESAGQMTTKGKTPDGCESCCGVQVGISETYPARPTGRSTVTFRGVPPTCPSASLVKAKLVVMSGCAPASDVVDSTLKLPGSISNAKALVGIDTARATKA